MGISIDGLIDEITGKLKTITGVTAIVLGGSRADDTHRSIPISILVYITMTFWN